MGYIFNQTEELIHYLLKRDKTMSQVRLHKTLYLLYAFYGGTYGSLEIHSEIEKSYPKELFDAEFEAWKYGPVIYEVFINKKNGQYDNLDHLKPFEPETKQQKDILIFIDELLTQIDQMSDFSLIDRVRQDQSWKDIYKQGREIMNNQDIIHEYAEYYNQEK